MQQAGLKVGDHSLAAISAGPAVLARGCIFSFLTPHSGLTRSLCGVQTPLRDVAVLLDRHQGALFSLKVSREVRPLLL